ncbi:NADP-dependent oxidoreductase [Paenibacillus tritici]|uniref:NADP-dependent oxidoreductase n=1 Tax=Paenibacillus tritici TaxID=1873425 RepID=UPI001BA5F7C2|nr:NADP-dependent oxidoreductase [Paenibacillus tritici]QUL52307.1 NADP-dependent oxidoreductase [Paenibacillus tritici]
MNQNTQNTSMKAIRIHQFGGIGELRYEEAPIPAPAADEILIKVAASGFNPVDVKIRMGYLQAFFPHHFPYIPGIEVSGIVERTGEAVTEFQAGDKVYAALDMSQDGGAAEYVVTKAQYAALAPASLELADAAALPVGVLTAWQGLFEHGSLPAGGRVLIAGAAGGVGSYAVQLAKLHGAYVIGTSSAASIPMLQELGIDEIIDYTRESVTDKLNTKVDLILNLSPENTEELNKWLPLLKEGGALVSAVNPADEQLAAQLGVRTHQIYGHADREQMTRMAALVDEGKLKLQITARLPLAELASAHAMSEAGKIRGKVLITV